MRGSIEEILNELGWDSGFRIPVANSENKRLEEEIDRKLRRKDQLIEDLTGDEERVKSIEQYISNVTVEHGHNQKLLTAYAAQYSAEDHLFRVSEREASSTVQEIKDLQKEKKITENKITALRREMEKLVDKLNSSEQIMALDKNKLVEWEEILSKEEEDEQLIEKYKKLDGKKLKELELKRQKLTVEAESGKNVVIQAMDEIREMEIILERTAQFYVQALEERHQLIQRWSQSVLVLRQRDSGIQETIREIETLKEIGKEKMAVLSESEEFMENQIKSNKQIEDSIRTLEKRLFVEKEERRRIVEHLALYELEYQTRKKLLEEISRRSQRLKSELKATKNDVANKNKKIHECTKQIEDIRATVNEIDNQSISTADRLKQLESMLETEEKRRSTIVRDTKRFQDLILRTTNKITQFEGEKKSLDLQKVGELKKVELFGMHQNQEEIRLREKREMNRQLNFEIQKCEMRLGKAGPDSFSRAELERKQKAIENLQRIFDEKMETAKLLQTQLTNLENDVRKIQNSLKSDNEELLRLKSKKQDVGLMMDGGEKHLKAAKKTNEEKQVAENILELRVTQAEQIMKNIGDKLYNLEKYRLQIDTAMKERMEEIRAQKEGLNLQKRLAVTECSELRSAINERQSRTQHLQSRYDNTIAALGTNEVDGEPVTTTYLKIQNAQEKAELQEQGDKLDATIRRTEQEIQSMENTLRIVNACNEKYKSSLGVESDESPEELQRKELEEGMLSALELMRLKRIQLEEANQHFQKMQETFEKLIEDLKKIKDEKELKIRAVSNLEKQIGEQKERLSRADKSLRKLYKDIQKMCENTDEDAILLQEKDIAARELQEQNLLALQRITEFTIRHVEAEVYVKKLLTAKNIVLPCTQHLKPSPSPSLCESGRSSAASSTGRNRFPSSRESVTRIHNIQPEFVFEVLGGSRTSKRQFSATEHASSGQRSSQKASSKKNNK